MARCLKYVTDTPELERMFRDLRTLADLRALADSARAGDGAPAPASGVGGL